MTRVAVVHDWLVTYGGSERVLEKVLAMFPHAEIFTLVNFMGDDHDFLRSRKIHTSFIQRLPFAKKKYRSYLPLMPLAIEQLDMRGFDVVISSSHAVAKGVITGPDQTHICICYSPIRYAWDLQNQYLQEAKLTKGLKSALARLVLHKMRIWDMRTANGVDHFLGISKYIQRRIRKCYGRDSFLLYPPVDTEEFSPTAQKKDFYLTASRMVPYKRIPLIIEAFAKTPHRKLRVIGTGPEWDRCKEICPPNVELLGFQPHSVLKQNLQDAKAFIFAAEEDFGIVPIEAQACGTPVIAYGRGAALETIQGPEHSAPTGVFFFEQTADSINIAIDAFERDLGSITADACRQNSLRFSHQVFHDQFADILRKTCNIDMKAGGAAPVPEHQ